MNIEHITESYGEPVNYIRLSQEDYWELRGLLASAGVQIRMISVTGGIVKAQIRNPYKEYTEIYGPHTAVPASKVREGAEAAIKSAVWER